MNLLNFDDKYQNLIQINKKLMDSDFNFWTSFFL